MYHFKVKVKVNFIVQKKKKHNIQKINLQKNVDMHKPIKQVRARVKANKIS